MTSARPPQLSLPLPTFRAEEPGAWERLRQLSQTADRVGVDRLVCSDHIVFGENLDAYGDPRVGGTRGGRQPTGPDGLWLEPLTVLAHVAAVTTGVRLGTSILLAALRRPVVLAKEVATLDVLSGGRVDLGVGVGWQREEYEAAGLPFERRGELLDHSLAVCRRLWRDRRATFADEWLRFDGIHMMPKPSQAGGVPIWVSGTINPRVVRRVARYGSAWIPWGDAAADLASAIPRMKQAVADAGGDAADLGVVGRLPLGADGDIDATATTEAIGSLVEAGVTDFRCYASLPEDPSAAEDRLADVVSTFRAAVGRTA